MLNNTFDKITQGGGNAVQSFDFYDLATGRGIKTLYCGDTNSGAVSYKMSPIQWYSDTGQHTFGYADKLTFEMKLNRPLIMEGEGIINVPCIHFQNVGTAVVSGAMWCYLYHSGAVQTLLGSATSQFLSGSVSQYNGFYKMHAMSINIPTTAFKSGEYIKLKIELSGSQAYSVQVGCDPMGRTSSNEMYPKSVNMGWGTTTALTFQMPMRIDV